MTDERRHPPDLDGARGPGQDRAPGERGFGLVEALVAVVLFGIGTVAVAGLTLATGTYASRAAVQTDHVMAAGQLFTELRQEDFTAVTSGTRTLVVGDRSYAIDVTVSQPSTDVKSILAVVPGNSRFSPDTFRTRIHRSGGYPTGP